MKDLQARLAAETDRELARRSLPGTLVYLVLFLVCVFGTGAWQQYPAASLGGALFIVWVGLYRLYLATHAGLVQFRRRFALATFVAGLSWGTCTALALHVYGLDWRGLLFLMVTSGIASGSLNSLCPDRPIMRTYLVVLLLPEVAVCLRMQTPEGHVFAGAILVYAAFMQILGAQQANFFRRALFDNLLLQRKRMSESQLSHRYELILNSAADGIVRTDLEGRITFANPAAARLTGRRVNEMVGNDLGSLFGRGLPHLLDQLEEHPFEAEIELRRSDGTRFPASCTVSPVDDGGRVGTVVLFHDVTERREIERAKEEFVSVVSHELRTPLTALRGALGILYAAPDVPRARAQQLLTIAVNNGDRLIRLVNDILEIEKIRLGKQSLQLQPCSPSDLIEQALEVIRPLAESAQVTLDSSLPGDEPQMLVDIDRVVRVLTNLLGNAVKFSPPQGTIRLEVRRVRQGHIQFRVSDQGRGIPEEQLQRIFEPFFQVDSSDARQKGGSGLGLAICRSIVEQHGGRIWAENNSPCGSTFVAELPITPTPDAEEPSAGS